MSWVDIVLALKVVALPVLRDLVEPALLLLLMCLLL
jgi:hypothetical protein